MSERKLLVGLDLCDDVSQICCYNEKTFEPECLGVDDQETNQYIPTVLTLKNDTREWLFGKEALLCFKEGKGECIDHLVRKIVDGEPFVLFGQEIPHVKVMRRLLSKILNICKLHYPTETILKLVVTVEVPELGLLEVIYQALEKLGIERERSMVIGHKQSYLYYALCQKKELWLNDVGMFDFSSKGLCYYQLIIDRGKKPMMVGITEKDYSESLNVEMVDRLVVDKEKIAYAFENIVKSAIHNQIISTLYMIGNGFDDDWPNPALQRLCMGRRVFKGKNLYVKGACYAARERSGNGRLEEFIFLDDDMLPCHIYAKMYVEAKEKEVVLIKAGIPWFDAQCSIDFIPDEEEELVLMVRNVVTKEVAEHLFPLEIVRDRARRMTRLNIRIRFVDKNTCIITIKDKGFGEMYKTTNRIWERTIQI